MRSKAEKLEPWLKVLKISTPKLRNDVHSMINLRANIVNYRKAFDPCKLSNKKLAGTSIELMNDLKVKVALARYCKGRGSKVFYN